MNTRNRFHTPGARDRALDLVRRLTYGTAGAAALGVAVLGAVAGITYPGATTTTTAATTTTVAAATTALGSTSTSSTVASAPAATAVPSTTTTTHAVSGGSR